MNIKELLENTTAARLILELIAQYGTRVHARLEGPMSAEAVMSGGRKRELPLMGGETFHVIAAVFKPYTGRRMGTNETNILLRLKPFQVEEYRHIEVTAMLAGGGVSYALAEENGNHGAWDLFPELIIKLMALWAGKGAPYTWGEVIKNAVARETQVEVKQQLNTHDKFGSW